MIILIYIIIPMASNVVQHVLLGVAAQLILEELDVAIPDGLE